MEDVTTFSEIFKRASYKLESEEFLEYSDRELMEDFLELLDEAIGMFDQCYIDKIVDYDKETISPALTPKEFKITTDCMVLSYIQREISKVTRFSGGNGGMQLTPSDYRTFSQANMLQQKQQKYSDFKSEIETQILTYGSQKAISFLNKKVGVEEVGVEE